MVIDPLSPATLSEDNHIIVVVKPAGLPTANASRGQVSLFTLLANRGPRGRFLGVVSRLDAAVSGVGVLAKTRAAAAELARQFRERLVEKSYEAIVEGRFPAALGRWVDWHDRLTRHGDDRRSRVHPGGGRAARGPGEERDRDGGEHMLDDPALYDPIDAGQMADGADCHVRARVVRRLGEVSLVDLVPSSGRRHQLRAQLAERGCPIVGDRTYGARLPFSSARGLGAAIALHARRLAFGHPHTGQRVEFAADRPAAWLAAYPQFGRGGDEPPPNDVGGGVSG
ncbi:MAG: RluA family pseudouridine synthase [Planctomycetia bacterium]